MQSHKDYFECKCGTAIKYEQQARSWYHFQEPLSLSEFHSPTVSIGVSEELNTVRNRQQKLERFLLLNCKACQKLQTCAPPKSIVVTLKITCVIARTNMKMCSWCVASRDRSGTFPCKKQTVQLRYTIKIKTLVKRNTSINESF